MEAFQKNNLAQCRAALTEKGADFLLLSPLPDTFVKVRFVGRFEGREVVWDMHLYTLQRYTQERGAATQEVKSTLRGLMNIAPETEHGYPLEVALNVPMIEEPTLKKTILMIRNYRKLSLGLHTWGDGEEFVVAQKLQPGQ